MADNKAEILLTAINRTQPAFDQVKRGMDGMAADAARAGGILGKLPGMLAALGVGLASGALVGKVREITEGLDALNDVADATGASIENISAMEDVAKRTGGTLETVQTTLLKFNQVLNQAGKDSPMEAALKAIGLQAEDLKRLDPAEAVLRVATALSGFADNADKARLVQVLFGKSTKEVAAFLKDMADRGKLVATVTTEQTIEAEKYNQQLAALDKNLEDISRTLVGKALPALNLWLERIARLPKNITSLGDEIEAWMSSNRLATVTSQIEAFTDALQKDPTNKEYKRRLEELRAEYTALSKSAADAADRLKDAHAGGLSEDQLVQQDAMKGYKPRSEGRTIQFDPANLAQTKQAQEAYDKLVRSINEKIAVQKQEIELGRPLTDSEKFLADATARIAEEAKNLTPALQAKARAYLENHKAIIKHNGAMLDGEAILRRNVAAWVAEADATRKASEDLAYELSLIGKTAGQQRELNEARERATLQRRLERAEAAAMLAQNESERQALEQQAEQLREQIRLRGQMASARKATEEDPTAGAQRAVDEYMEKVKKAGDATHDAVSRSISSLEDALTEFVSTGKTDVQSLVNSMIAEFMRLEVVRPLLGSILGAANGGAGSAAAASGGDLLSTIRQFFAGFFADGGHIPAGKWGWAGERGPEPVYGGSTGVTVVSADNVRGGAQPAGITIVQHVTVQSGVSRTEVAAAMEVAKETAKAEILDSMRRNGIFSR